MSAVDHLGMLHAGAGTSGGERFTGKVSTAPAEALHMEDAESPTEPDWEWTPRTYRIPTANLGALHERIAKANKRLAPAGIEERFDFASDRRMVRDERTGLQYVTNDVTLNTPRIAADEWRLDCAHELGANGRVISHYAHGVEAVLDDSKDLLVCEHCGHRRARTGTVGLRASTCRSSRPRSPPIVETRRSP
jgi:hypothetical protein